MKSSKRPRVRPENYFNNKIKISVKALLLWKKVTIPWKTKMFSTRYRFENCFGFYLNYNHFVWKSLRVKPSRFWEKTKLGASLDIRGIPAHRTDSLWDRSVLFVGVFCEERCFVRVWKTTQRFENPTRVLKKLKKVEKNWFFWQIRYFLLKRKRFNTTLIQQKIKKSEKVKIPFKKLIKIREFPDYFDFSR